MATRATYQIDGKVFYIQGAGYPEGAAVYFWNMYKALASSRGDKAAAFLRANDGAEFTGTHATHGDTEWRYTITGDTLTVHKRTEWDAPEFASHWVGSWWDFVNGNAEHITEWEPLEPVAGAYSADRARRVVDRAALTAAAQKAADELLQYVANHPSGRGNIAYMQTELNRAIEALQAYGEKYPHAKRDRVAA